MSAASSTRATIWRYSAPASARSRATTASTPCKATANPTSAGTNSRAVTNTIPVLGEPSIDRPPGSAASPIGGSTPEATKPKPRRREELAAGRALRTERRLTGTRSAAGISGDQSGDGSVTLTTSHSPQQCVSLDGAWAILYEAPKIGDFEALARSRSAHKKQGTPDR